MGSHAHLAPILRDEAMTRDLGDEEARILIDWLIDWAEVFHRDAHQGPARIQKLWRRGRALARFVALWTGDRHGAALQLAAAERFDGPLPNGPVDAVILMQRLVQTESRHLREGAPR